MPIVAISVMWVSDWGLETSGREEASLMSLMARGQDWLSG